MKRNPKGCSNIGGKMAAKLEYCRNRALELFALYGYRPFSPAEFQLLSDIWDKLSPNVTERLIALTSPYGEPCVLRGDLTLSAVTYLSTHFQDEERPLRLSYADRIFSIPTAPKQNLEQNQIGVELIGWEGSGADAEVISLLFRTLDELEIDSIIAIGDTSAMSKIFAALPQKAADALIANLQKSSYTAYAGTLNALDLPDNMKTLLSALPTLKGGIEVLDEAEKLTEDKTLFSTLRNLCKTLSALGYAERIRIDLGFLRDLGYYSGPIFNAYTRNGVLLGGGGRYDGLLTKLDMEGEAAGFALDLKELADNCKGSLPLPKLMLWGSSENAAECLAMAEEIREQKKSFEISWCAKEDSVNTARLRNYSYWINSAAKTVMNLNSGETTDLSGFDWRNI